MRIPYDVPVSVGRELVAIGSDIAAAILLTMEAGWALAATSPDMHGKRCFQATALSGCDAT